MSFVDQAIPAVYRKRLLQAGRALGWVGEAAAVLLALVVGLWAYLFHWPVAVRYVPWALLLLLVSARARKVWAVVFGPVFLYDLVRTARKGRLLGHRALYAVFLLAALYLVYDAWFPVNSWQQLMIRPRVSPTDMSRLAQSFFNSFLGVQFAAVLLVTPAYLAGVIAEERQKRTLEFLLATDLNNREIVLGLMVSRLANLFLLFLTGLPVLCLIQFMGGVEPNLVLAGFTASLLTMLGLGGVCIAFSTTARSPLDAILASYCVMLVQSGLPSGIVFACLISGASQPLALLATVCVYALYQAGFFLACLRVAVTGLRVKFLRPPGLLVTAPEVGPPPVALEPPEANWGPFEAAEARTSAFEHELDLPVERLRPPLGEDAVLWKELPVGIGILGAFRFLLTPRAGVYAALLFLAAFMVSLVVDPVEAGERAVGDATNPLMRLWGCVLFCLSFLYMAVLAAFKISRERDQQTLDCLLTTPWERHQLLFSKWLASILPALQLWCFVLPMWLVGVLTGGLHVVALPLLLGAGFVYAACLSALGLWFSTVSGSTLRAVLFTILAGLVLVLGPGLLSRAVEGRSYARAAGSGPAPWQELFLEQGLSPPLTLWALAFSSGDLAKDPEFVVRQIVAALCGLYCYLCLAALTWWATVRRLEALKGPPPDRAPEPEPA